MGPKSETSSPGFPLPPARSMGRAASVGFITPSTIPLPCALAQWAKKRGLPVSVSLGLISCRFGFASFTLPGFRDSPVGEVSSATPCGDGKAKHSEGTEAIQEGVVSSDEILPTDGVVALFGLRREGVEPPETVTKVRPPASFYARRMTGVVGSDLRGPDLQRPAPRTSPRCP
eukprot:scaffold1088_cov247-Pinguiococcus_pyrenoidosus.AAC.19